MSFNSNPINQEQLTQSNKIVNSLEHNSTVASNTPSVSTFEDTFGQATTFDSGKCIPIFLKHVEPYSTTEISTNTQIRLSAMSSQPLENINYDINYFFVPYSKIDPQFKNVMGESNSVGYDPETIEFPQLEFDQPLSYTENDLANYFNIKINCDFSKAKNLDQSNIKFNLYPFLAYIKIVNDWYRDQNYQSEIDFSSVFKDSRILKSSTFKSSMTYLESLKYGKGLAPSNKLPSIFRNCLPYQQKGPSIKIGSVDLQDMYVTNNDSKDNEFQVKLWQQGGINPGTGLAGFTNGTFVRHNGGLGTQQQPLFTSLKVTTNNPVYEYNVNDLRYSIVTQHLLEAWALCGSRYVEQLKRFWGIEINPLEIDRSELIGGFTGSLVYNMVQQQSQTTENNPLGSFSANVYNSINNDQIVEYSASQHGLIIGILTIRTNINLGGQGVPHLFTQKNFLDFHNPEFNGIGEQPVQNSQIFWDENNPSDINNKTFGYNEPFINDKINYTNANGYLSLESKQSMFSIYLFGEKYESTPKLNADWINFNPKIINNTLYQYDSKNNEFYHQFIAYFTFSIAYTFASPIFNSPQINKI